MEYASKGVAGAGLGLGIAGTALGILNGGGLLMGSNGLAGHAANYVTKEELDYVQSIASKDSQIALLQSENDSEKKMIEVYTALAKQDKELRAELQAFKESQMGVNAQQGIINTGIAVNGTNIAAIQAQLGQITKYVIPNSSVCPGWGQVQVTPITTGTTIS